MGASEGKKKSGFIVSRWYDLAFFLLPPVLSLWLGVYIAGTDFSDKVWTWEDQPVTWSTLLIGVLIHAHLVIVFVRSHGNGAIFKQYRMRFVVVPILLYLAMITSNIVIYCCSVVATFWDVYHSGMQTFGFGRIYEGKAGNDPNVSRRLDWMLNQLLYAGPILAGATMMDHFEDFHEFEDIGVMLFAKVPVWMEGNQRYFAWSLIIGGTIFLMHYTWAQYVFWKRGHTISWQKVFLYVSTGACSIYTWGFNSWGEAFFIMNLFHAIQYFGIVWAMENRNMQRKLRVDGLPFGLGKVATLALFVGLAAAYGRWVQAMDASAHEFWAITLIVALMHFWYDGFIWSVRKKQV